MKSRIIPKAALLCAALLGFAAPCPANEAGAAAPDSVQKVQTEEAIITAMEQNRVTLQSATDPGKTSTLTTSVAAGLKVGDRVTVVGTTLKKCDSAPGNGGKGEAAPSASAAPTSHNAL